MKVFLTTSYLGGNEPLVFPLGLAYLKAGLTGHEVRAMDLNASADPYAELAENLSAFQPDVVGISLRNIDSTNKRVVHFYYEYVATVVDIVQKNTHAKLIIGGSGFSIFAETIMADQPGIDYGVFLEGEHTLPRLLENMNTPGDVPGVWFRKNGKIHFSGPPAVTDFKTPLRPDFSVVPMAPYLKVKDAVGVETKRGCALGCIYCIYPFLNGRRYRLKSPPLIVDEIQELVTRFGVTQFMFIDSIFNKPRSHAEAICEELIRRNLDVTWSAWLSERHLDEPLIRTMVSAGCRLVIFSPDAMEDPVLKKLGKDVRKKDILNAFRLLKAEPALEIGFNFFKNPPGQTLKNFISVITFILKGKRLLGQRIHFELNSLRIEPHTRLHKIALKEKAIQKETGLLYPAYYVNRKTRIIDRFFNFLLRLKGK